jgi:hypothetical protein
MVGSPSMWSTRSRLFCAVRDEEGGDQLSDYGVVDRVPPTVAARDPHPTPRPWAVGPLPRSQLVAQLADQVRLNAGDQSPGWAARPHPLLPAELIADLQVWRAATQVDPNDLRPTGPPQLGRATRIFQQQLDIRLAADTNTDWQWRQLLATEVPSATKDPFLPQLAERLSNLTRAGFDATLLVRSAAAAAPLPDDHPAAALWWRILDQLPPQTPNHKPATERAVPTTRRAMTTSHNRRPPVPRSAPPPTFRPSR